MPSQLILGTGRKRFFVYAIAIAAFSTLLASGTKAQSTTNAKTTRTKWTVLIDETSPNPKPYSVSSSPPNPTSNCSGSPSKPQPTNGDVYVCPGDTVQWVAVTTKDPSQNMHSAMLIFHEDSILYDSETEAGTVTDDSTQVGSHEYYVFVVDKLTKQVYADDPQIRIGTGGGGLTSTRVERNKVDQIRDQVGQLSKLLQADPMTKPQAQKQAQRVVKDLDKLKDLLHSQ